MIGYLSLFMSIRRLPFKLYILIRACIKESSFRLVKDIQIALEESSIQKPDAILCGIGPGSFTGIRIAVSTARNLAQLWEIPVKGVDSLKVYSSYYYYKTKNPSFVVLDAKQKKVYAAYYDEDGFYGSMDIPPKELEISYKEKFYTYSVYSDVNLKNIATKNIREDLPSPDLLATMCAEEIFYIDVVKDTYKNLHPAYMRASYAEQ